MMAPDQLDILYTYSIKGDLDLLPPLYSFMRQLMQQADLQKPLWLDLGLSCHADVWPCALTGGRSTLVVLDGMGYHAANVAGVLDPSVYPKLAAQVRMGLVDDTQNWIYDIPPARDEQIIACLRPPEHGDYRLQIVLAPAEETRLSGNILYLGAVAKGVVGLARVDLRGHPRLLAHSAHALSTGAPPNPTIAGIVDFVRSEARYYDQRQSS